MVDQRDQGRVDVVVVALHEERVLGAASAELEEAFAVPDSERVTFPVRAIDDVMSGYQKPRAAVRGGVKEGGAPALPGLDSDDLVGDSVGVFTPAGWT